MGYLNFFEKIKKAPGPGPETLAKKEIKKLCVRAKKVKAFWLCLPLPFFFAKITGRITECLTNRVRDSVIYPHILPVGFYYTRA